MDLVIGQKVSGSYWNKSTNRHGMAVPITAKNFTDGIVIGFTKAGGPIISVRAGNMRFNVYRTKIDS